MVAKTYTGTVQGVEGLLVRVEADVRSGLRAFKMVGLPDTAVREAKERVHSALENSGFSFPTTKVTINLAPAAVKKQGSAFDLAVAVGIATAMNEASERSLEDSVLLGELALDGSLRGVRGVLPVVAEARRRRKRRVVVPRANAAEAALVRGVTVLAADSLREVIDLLGTPEAEPFRPPPRRRDDPAGALDLSDVKGQRTAKRALEIAAAGGHNVLLVGPPGAGKSLLASRLPSLLPRLTTDEALEVTKIYSVAGLLDGTGLVERAPFRAPHHTISTAAMIGGGSSGAALPGEASLAHRGVLFLDELAEFPRAALETLRQPLEEGRVRIRRVDRMAAFPARFVLVGATNPCPCGGRGAESRACECTPAMVRRYQAKLSGPLLDRIDLRVPVRALGSEELMMAPARESSLEVRSRVERARRAQRRRLRRRGAPWNGAMAPRELDRYCGLGPDAQEILRRAVDRLSLSARAFDRIRKVARTIADLDGCHDIVTRHVEEAILYRGGLGHGGGAGF